MWRGGKAVHLKAPVGYGVSSLDLNDSGEAAVLFTGDDMGDDQALLWTGTRTQTIPLPHLFEADSIWVNESGQVLVNGIDRWILWQKGHRIGSGAAQATALNRRGQVTIADWDGIALISQNGKTMRLPARRGDDGAIALAVNDGSYTVGLSGSLDMSDMHDQVWRCDAVAWTWQPA